MTSGGRRRGATHLVIFQFPPFDRFLLLLLMNEEFISSLKSPYFL